MRGCNKSRNLGKCSPKYIQDPINLVGGCNPCELIILQWYLIGIISGFP